MRGEEAGSPTMGKGGPLKGPSVCVKAGSHPPATAISCQTPARPKHRGGEAGVLGTHSKKAAQSSLGVSDTSCTRSSTDNGCTSTHSLGSQGRAVCQSHTVPLGSEWAMGGPRLAVAPGLGSVQWPEPGPSWGGRGERSGVPGPADTREMRLFT